MPSTDRVFLRLLAAALLVSPALADLAPASAQLPVQDGPAMLGPPFHVGAQIFTPVDTPRYDEVGYALVMAGDGRSATANGEAYVSTAINGAHKTLPLPSYVEVTALDTGKTIIVRLNDRGPMDKDRLIALTPAAAEQLGLSPTVASPVRVRRVNPSEQERAVLRAGKRAGERLPPPKPLLAVLHSKLPPLNSAPTSPVSQPAAVARPRLNIVLPVVPEAIASSDTAPAMPVTAPAAKAAPGPGKGWMVQLGAFATRARAQALAAPLGAKVSQHGPLWRVRTGPYSTDKAARAGLEKAQSAGFNAAKIVLND